MAGINDLDFKILNSKIVSIIIALIPLNMIYSQEDFYVLYSRAKVYESLEINDSAALYYKRAMPSVPEDEQTTFWSHYALVLFRLGETERATESLLNAYRLGAPLKWLKITYKNEIKNDPSFWNPLISTCDSLTRESQKQLDISLIKKINEILTVDQWIRCDTCRNLTCQQLVPFSLKKVDSVNAILLERIFRETGFPTLRSIDHESWELLYIVLYHTSVHVSKTQWDYFENLLKEVIATRRLEGGYLASLIDARRVRKKMLPVYGEFPYDMTLEGRRNPQLEDASNVDKLRRELGVYTTMYEKYIMGYYDTLPPGYVPDSSQVEYYQKALELKKK
jgi:tetratricopeptide (TPR) repeat protein